MKAAQDIIIKPIITEESMTGIMMKKYTFKVAKDAGKIEIKKAVEELFPGHQGEESKHPECKRAEAPPGRQCGLHPLLEEGCGYPHRGLQGD